MSPDERIKCNLNNKEKTEKITALLTVFILYPN